MPLVHLHQRIQLNSYNHPKPFNDLIGKSVHMICKRKIKVSRNHLNYGFIESIEN